MTKPRHCGIIMPISGTTEYSAKHWEDVQSILKEAAIDGGLVPDLVSTSSDSAVIQKTIITNLYENELVICDVSGRNPNVMLELGMRLAFDKPVVIVKDRKTLYPFDTSPLRYIEYPEDLHFYEIKRFKEQLTKALQIAASADQSKTFLKSFGDFKVATIDTTQVPRDELIFDELRSLRVALANRSNAEKQQIEQNYFSLQVLDVSVKEFQEVLKTVMMEAAAQYGVPVRGYPNAFGGVIAVLSLEIHKINQVASIVRKAEADVRSRRTNAK